MRRINWFRIYGVFFLLVAMSGIITASETSIGVRWGDFYLIKKWTTQDGLPMNSVLALAQTPEGYLWVGSETGLSRFDGVRFEVFSTDNAPELGSGIILTLLSDNRGGLWIGTRGAGLAQYSDGVFNACDPGNPQAGKEVWSLIEAPDKNIWLGTEKGVFGVQDGKLIRLPLPAEFSTMKTRELYFDRKGRLWIGTEKDGLFLLQLRARQYEVMNRFFPEYCINSIMEDRSGGIWVGTKEAGAALLTDNDIRRFAEGEGLTSLIVGPIHEDPEGNIWLGTKGGGIFVLQRNTQRFEPFSTDEDIGSRWIGCMLRDRENILWIGSQGGGLGSIRDTRVDTYTVRNGLAANQVFGVFEDSLGYIWTGAKGEGASRIDPRTGQTAVFTKKEGLSSNIVITFAEYPKGVLWLGTSGGGLNRRELPNGPFKTFSIESGLKDSFTRTLFVSSRDVFWVATDSRWLHHFRDGRFIPVMEISGRPNHICEDREGRIWVSTYGSGLVQINGNDVHVFDTRNGLADNFVNFAFEDHDGALWICMHTHGAARFKDGVFTRLSRKNGLPDNTLYFLMRDHKNHLWGSCNQGIFCLYNHDLKDFLNGKKSTLSPLILGIEDGMRSLECNGGSQPPGCRSRDGRFWFPTVGGLSSVDPSNLYLNMSPPPIIIENVMVEGEIFNLHQKNSFDAPPDKKYMEIHYTSLSFLEAGKIRFRYKLENWDEEWRDVGVRRFAVYSGLPPGKYRFRVAARNCDGVWSNRDAVLDIRIHARFYQTLTFRILAPLSLLLFAGALVWLFRKFYSIRRVRKNKTNLPPDETRVLMRLIMDKLEKEKAYQDPNLSINAFARMIRSNPRKISQVIHAQLGKSFFDLVNQHRVEEAKTRLMQPSAESSAILDICFEVGFNSKSSFNRVFKTYTGMTPSEFRKKNSDSAI